MDERVGLADTEFQKLVRLYLPDITENENTVLDHLRSLYKTSELIVALELAIARTAVKFIQYKVGYLRAILSATKRESPAEWVERKIALPDPFCAECDGAGGEEIREKQGRFEAMSYTFWKKCSCVRPRIQSEYDALVIKKLETTEGGLQWQA